MYTRCILRDKYSRFNLRRKFFTSAKSINALNGLPDSRNPRGESNGISQFKVIKAVRGRVPVLFDGGICRGTDLFKALAIGAQAVLVGRPIIYGLAVKGESGVKKVLEMLHDELELAMSLSGCCRVKDITRSHVQTEYEIIRSML